MTEPNFYDCIDTTLFKQIKDFFIIQKQTKSLEHSAFNFLVYICDFLVDKQSFIIKRNVRISSSEDNKNRKFEKKLRKEFNQKFKNFKLEDDKITLCIGDTQSGKSFLMIPLAFLILSLGYSVVLVCLNNNLKEQMETRIVGYARELLHYLESKGVALTAYQKKMFSEPMFFDSIYFKKNEDIYKKELDDALYNAQPRIILTLKHFKHVEILNNIIRENEDNQRARAEAIGTAHEEVLTLPKFCLILDEYQVTGVIKDDADENDDVKYDARLKMLRNYCLKEIGFTATANDVYFNMKIPVKNICLLPTKPEYRGSAMMVSITENTKPFEFVAEVEERRRQGLNVNVKNVEQIVQYVKHVKKTKIVDVDELYTEVIQPQEPIVRVYKNRSNEIVSDNLPTISLLINEREKSSQQTQVINLLNKNKNIHTFGVIVFTGESITLIEQNLFKDVIVKRENGIVVKLNKRNGIYGKFDAKDEFFDKRIVTFNKNIISIQDAIEWFGNFGKEGWRSPVKHVVIIAYDMINCGSSLISHFTGNLNYHLTHIFCFLKNYHQISVIDLLQKIGRMCGNHGDDVGLVLVIFAVLEEQWKKAVNFNEAQKKRILDLQNADRDVDDSDNDNDDDNDNNEEEEQMIGDFLASEPLLHNRLPRNNHKIKAYVNNYNLVQNPRAKSEDKAIRSSIGIDRTAGFYGNNVDHLIAQRNEMRETRKRHFEENPEPENFYPTTTGIARERAVNNMLNNERANRERKEAEEKEEDNDNTNTNGDNMELEEDVDDSQDYRNGNEYIEGVDKKKLRSFLQPSNETLVARMVKCLYAQTEPISVRQFKLAMNYKRSDEQFGKNLKNGCGKHSQYGKLWNSVNSQVELNPIIRNYIDSRRK